MISAELCLSVLCYALCFAYLGTDTARLALSECCKINHLENLKCLTTTLKTAVNSFITGDMLHTVYRLYNLLHIDFFVQVKQRRCKVLSVGQLESCGRLTLLDLSQMELGSLLYPSHKQNHTWQTILPD